MAAAQSSSSGNEKRVERTYTKLLPPHVTTAAEAYDAWLQYAWIGGADLPLAKAPVILERGDLQSGNGLLRRIPPIGIEEKIVDASYPARVEYKVNLMNWIDRQTECWVTMGPIPDSTTPLDTNTITIQVMNPGWTTYQVYDHKGEVRFEEVSDEGGGKRVKVSWLLSVRPWFGFGRRWWWRWLLGCDVFVCFHRLTTQNTHHIHSVGAPDGLHRHQHDVEAPRDAPGEAAQGGAERMNELRIN